MVETTATVDRRGQTGGAQQGRDARGEPVEVRVPLGHRANNGRMLVALAVAGLGIAFEPDFIVAPEIQSGRLHKVLSPFQPAEAVISAVYPSRRHLSAKVRQLVDDLAAQFAEAAPWRID